MSDIDTEPPPAVKNLRSKFEQLAVASTSKGPGLSPGFAPRQRATSGSQPNGERAEGSANLRSSSSSSDLRKKPPPPPTPRSGKPTPASTPNSSPRLRPVVGGSPVPALGHRSSLSSVVSAQDEEEPTVVEETSTLPSVSSLRSVFADPVSSSKPLLNRPSLTGQLITHSEPELSGIHRPPPPIPRLIHQIPDDEVSSPEPLSSSDGDPESPVARPTLPPRPFTHNHQRTSSSQTSSEGDTTVSRLPPPRPPPRHRSPPKLVESSATMIPPPLPNRRPTAVLVEEPTSYLPPPRLPARPAVTVPNPDLDSSSSASTPTTAERKAFGRLPPPPTRTIALGEKLPPARRPASPNLSSDEESGDESHSTSAVDLPDSSRSSRRPPHLSSRAGYVGPNDPKIPVAAHHGLVIVSGTRIVVATLHHLKIYDTEHSETPIFTLEKRDVGNGHGIKELRITSMEYRPCHEPANRGCLLWIGTKEGHMAEVDVRSGCVTAIKLSAHLHPIVRIFRHGRSMITLDEAGKTLLFTPSENDEDIDLTSTLPRVLRITEKQDFAQMICGKLWTASRSELHGARLQTIRIFDLFFPGAPARSVLPLEAVGAVTDATMLPSKPGIVFLGHEGGSVSLWSLEEEDGWPRCIEVIRVSTSDVLCLEGVNDRLWAGGRNGMITAYDVSVKPWLATNCWQAHQKLPVTMLAVDHYGIEKTGRLSVASVGRDEQLKLWDGLLGLDWVDKELLKREASFSKFRDLSVLIISWNCDSARPESLSGDPVNINFLHEALTSVDCPDIITFGFQELVDLESRKLVAKNVLLGRKDKQDASIAQITGLSGLSEKVTTAYRKWYEHLIMAVRLAMPTNVPYTVIHTESLVGLFTCVFVKHSERMSIKDNVITSMKRGMGGRYGNKGGIITRLVIEDSSLCFINCHLAAGQHATRARNADVAAMLEEQSLLPPSQEDLLAYVGGGDGQMALDHEIVFLNGDMNYRIDQRREVIAAAVKSGELESLLAHDQLLKEIKFNRGCRLRGFSEGPLNFAPTYKYDRNSDIYDTSDKARAPAWCDRVLWRTRTPNRVQQLHYRRYEARVSDHRPVSAAFKVTVKSIRHDVRQKAKTEVQSQWAAEQERLLGISRDFYVDLALI
ncbi:IPPc domain-containing protein [Mycena indigotica]|uniref:IPPc domain-containing protein n=1 Tax=Mycena indigotica TaxID=2126181 RepID=A0A8H6SLT8_9AGAR|nr:IPPc domain-containing protein [Mycena indigotica]KAF7301001.1 IPPc domain-containing protein [Mycena indigotica]